MLGQTVIDTKALVIRGQAGFTAGAGLARCGHSRCGANKDFGGIYQRKKTLTGWDTSRMRVYRPSNPQTTAQQAWRAKFAVGISGYQALTADEKIALNKEARRYRQSGLTLFMSRYLASVR